MKTLKQYILDRYELAEGSFNDWLNLGKAERENRAIKNGAKGVITKTSTGVSHRALGAYTGDDINKSEIDPNQPKRGRGRPFGSYSGEYKPRKIDKSISAAKSAETKAANRAKLLAMAAEGFEGVSLDEIHSLEEEFEQLDELSKETIRDYVRLAKASKSKSVLDNAAGRVVIKGDKAVDHKLSIKNRRNGIYDANSRLSTANEEAENLDEISGNTLKSYVRRAATDKFVLGAKASGAIHTTVNGISQFDKLKDAQNKSDRRSIGIASALHRLVKR